MGFVIDEKAMKKDIILMINKVFIRKLEQLTGELTKVKSGALKRGWFVTEIEPLLFVIDNEQEYAQYIDAGTGIFATKGYPDYSPMPGRHPIYPLKKKALAFRIGGMQIIVKSVKGIAPRKILQALSLSKDIEKKLQIQLDSIIKKHVFSPFENQLK